MGQGFRSGLVGCSDWKLLTRLSQFARQDCSHLKAWLGLLPRCVHSPAASCWQEVLVLSPLGLSMLECPHDMGPGFCQTEQAKKIRQKPRCRLWPSLRCHAPSFPPHSVRAASSIYCGRGCTGVWILRGKNHCRSYWKLATTLDIYPGSLTCWVVYLYLLWLL